MIDKLQLALDLFSAGDLENARKIVEGYSKEIDKIKAVESRPKGKWVANSQYFQAFNETVTTYKCSECQGEPYFSMREGIEIYKYCPFCGADMREGE